MVVTVKYRRCGAKGGSSPELSPVLFPLEQLEGPLGILLGPRLELDLVNLLTLTELLHVELNLHFGMVRDKRKGNLPGLVPVLGTIHGLDVPVVSKVEVGMLRGGVI